MIDTIEKKDIAHMLNMIDTIDMIDKRETKVT